MIEINKSSRHSKITGNFSESLVLYWLSKHGFECANIDHTGIDIIARNPITDELMGISVKSRSRNTGKEGNYMSIPNQNFDKVEEACKAFSCSPYFAIVIDEAGVISVYILEMKRLLEYFPKRKLVVGWKMNNKWKKVYDDDEQIIKFEFKYNTKTWW